MDAAVSPQPVTDAYLIMDGRSACAAVADTEPGPQFTGLQNPVGPWLLSVEWTERGLLTAYKCRH